MVFNLLSIFGRITKIIKDNLNQIFIEFHDQQTNKVVITTFKMKNFGNLNFRFNESVKELMIDQSTIGKEGVLINGELTIGETFLLVNFSGEFPFPQPVVLSSAIKFIDVHLLAYQLQNYFAKNEEFLNWIRMRYSLFQSGNDVIMVCGSTEQAILMISIFNNHKIQGKKL